MTLLEIVLKELVKLTVRQVYKWTGTLIVILSFFAFWFLHFGQRRFWSTFLNLANLVEKRVSKLKRKPKAGFWFPLQYLSCFLCAMVGPLVSGGDSVEDEADIELGLVPDMEEGESGWVVGIWSLDTPPLFSAQTLSQTSHPRALILTLTLSCASVLTVAGSVVEPDNTFIMCFRCIY